MGLTIEMAQGIVDCGGEDAGVELSVYPEYSGRGMYGETCVGIIAPTFNDFLRAAVAYAFMIGDVNGSTHDGDYGRYYDLQDFLENARQDNMGKDIIIY
jgi:hypothetical protein